MQPIEVLRERYLNLVRRDLPAAAAASREPWPIRLDHCFMRVVLDNLLGGCWYEVLDRRKPAYRQLSAEQLQAAIELGESMLAGGAERTNALNARSLTLRSHARGTQSYERLPGRIWQT